ncbi:MAG: hypothetical protein KIT02_13070 [Devosia sp.]|uniref:hypothetical protein n=1 Tax=Devosia sp. TaxID=1871048 RepID=UPI0024CBE982|nr:hypothetical protein [Devosia sp.]UYN98859.1 MAG: hypothetical protein KIT02_13070 [Devosia sp.]
MTIELIDITLAERQPHPRLAARLTGRVRAVLMETIDERQYQHELMVPVWVDQQAGMDDSDVEMAMLVKAAGIVGRLKANLARPAGSALPAVASQQETELPPKTGAD